MTPGIRTLAERVLAAHRDSRDTKEEDVMTGDVEITIRVGGAVVEHWTGTLEQSYERHLSMPLIVDAPYPHDQDEVTVFEGFRYEPAAARRPRPEVNYSAMFVRCWEGRHPECSGGAWAFSDGHRVTCCCRCHL